MSLTVVITVVKSETSERIIWCCVCRLPVLILPVEVGLCQNFSVGFGLQLYHYSFFILVSMFQWMLHFLCG